MEGMVVTFVPPFSLPLCGGVCGSYGIFEYRVREIFVFEVEKTPWFYNSENSIYLLISILKRLRINEGY